MMPLPRLYVGAIVCVLVAAPAGAQITSTWTGLATPDNNWTTAGNWDSGVPDSLDTALFNGAGNGNTTVNLGGATQPINSILFQSGAAAYTIGQSAADALSFDNNGVLFVNAGVTTAQIINADVRTNGLLEVHNSVPNGLSGVAGEGLIGLTLGAINIGSGGHLIVDNGVGGVINATTALNGTITETPGQPGRVSLRGSTAGINNNTNFILNGNNSYTGGTTVQVNTGTNGGIYIGTDTAFGTGKITNKQQNNVPEYRAINGPRTIANDIDLDGGINFNGTNSFLFTGDFAIISSSSRTLRNKITGGATVTLGDSSGSSTFYLGNPADTVGRTLILAAETGSTMTVNAVLTDPADPNVVGNSARGSLQFGGGTAGGIMLMNSLSTYTGPTLMGGGANCIVQFNHDYNAGDPSGPFGLGALTTNNTGTFQSVGGNRTLANPVVISDNAVNSHLQFSNATGDTSGLTLTGPITMETAGRNITNNFGATGGILTLGSAASPSTLTLPTAAGQTLTIAGTGRTVINNTIQDAPGPSLPSNITVSNTATTTFNGPQFTHGNLTISGSNATVLMNGNRTGTGNISLTGANSKLFVHGSKAGGGSTTIGISAILAGTGSLDGPVTNNGTIAPGDETLTPGTLTLTGNVTNNADSHWLIGLAGATSGKLAIGGNLDLTALDSLDVLGTGSGSSWVIATYAGTLTGTFDNVTSGYTVDYGTLTNSQITLMTAGLPGDFNDDGKVDAADYVVWRKNETANAALPNDNGLATQADRFNLWRSNFGNPMGSGSGALNADGAVPEPATMVLLLLAIAVLPAACARRRSVSL